MATINGDDSDNILTGTDADAGTIIQISTNSLGEQANASCIDPVFSGDGTMVAFASKASNLASGDDNGAWDIYAKNLVTGETTLVSANAGGVVGDKDSLEPAFSFDGTKVAFSSEATNLVPGDTNGARELFVKDLTTGDVRRIAVDSSGNPPDDAGKSFDPIFSHDGSKVAFYSWAALDPADTNGARDIYVKDLTTGAVTLVSRAADGTIADKQSIDPVFSPDGTRVAFSSWASNLVDGDTNGEKDIFVKDLTTGAITLVSTSSTGEAGDEESGPYYTAIAFSPDGTKVAFASEASNFVAGDDNDAPDIFVKNLVTGEIVCASTSASGEVGNDDSGQWQGSIEFSPGGTKVIFSSAASNLVAGDTNGVADVFMKDLVTGEIVRLSTDAFGNQSEGAAYRPAFSPDGTIVVFEAAGTNLVPDDHYGHPDIFLKTIGASGADRIDGGAGNDTIDGGSGDDVLIGGDGNDVLDGGVGIDTADYGDAAAAVTVSLATTQDQSTGGAGIDRLTGIESLNGSQFGDTLSGSGQINFLSGQGCNDTLHGRGGDDILTGGAGNDVLDGGHDWVDHSKDEYVRKGADGESIHTNTIEGFFSVFKRGMKGVFQHCNERHLARYLAEFDFRYNNRESLGVNDSARTERALKGAKGKRLTCRGPDSAVG